MALEPTILKNANDAYVAENTPKKNYGNTKTLFLGTSAGTTRYAYIYFALPIHRGANVLSAKLRVYNTKDWAGSQTISVNRVASRWAWNTIHWDNKPAIIGTTHSLNKTSPVAGTMWEIDVKSSIQTIANGGTAWYGFRLDVGGSAIKSIWSASANQIYRPQLEVSWADKPDAPEKLYPGDGQAVSKEKPFLDFDFVDPIGDGTMNACQVQIHTSNSFTAPYFDSGTVFTGVSQLDLDGFSYARDVTVNTTLNSPTVTAASGTFAAADVGATIAGTGIPAGTTITVFTSSTQVTISANASATGSPIATITRTFAVLANDAIRWWRVRVQDGSGNWSNWSEAEQFIRKTHGTLTIDNPSSAFPFIQENTPPILWTFSGRTQKHYQVWITKPSQGNLVKWNSGKKTSTGTTITVPQEARLRDDQSYRLHVRVWDDVYRAKTPNDNIYVTATRDFTFQYDATTNPVTDLTVNDVQPYPWSEILWSRAAAPDRFEVYRGSRMIKQGIADVFHVSGTSYRFVDIMPNPYVSNTYKVIAVVNGKGSATNPTVSKVIKATTTTLSDDSGTSPVLFWNAEVDFERVNLDEVVYLAGDVPPVLVSGGTRGFEGTVTGILSNAMVPGITSRDMRDRFLALARDKGRTLMLTIKDEAFECFIYDVTYFPIKKQEDIIYQASFSFAQTDF